MTEAQLKIELMCYKEHVDPSCDIDNMTMAQMDEFFEMYVATEKYAKKLVKNSGRLHIPIQADL
ncbi:MAG: hypothetical protein OCD02_04215 [Spirochaetaceae bacterium]